MSINRVNTEAPTPGVNGKGQPKHEGLTVGPPSRNFRDYLLMIRERWLIGLLLGIIAAGCYAYFRLQREPVYEAVASILIETQADRVVNIQEVVDNSLRGQNELNNHLVQMNSRSFRSRVIGLINERDAARITEPYDEPDKKASLGQIIGQGLSIYLPTNSQVFYFKFKHRDPEVAAMLANMYAREYIQYLIERSSVGETSANQFLEAQAAKLKKEIEAGEQALQEYRAKHNLVSLEESQNIIVSRLQSLNAALTEARVAKLAIQAKIAQVESARESGNSLLEIPAIIQYANLASLVQEEQTKRSERNLLSQKYLERHPKMVHNENELRELDSQIREVTQQAVADLLSQQEEANNRFEKIKADLTEAEKDALELDQRSIQYDALKREVENDRQMFRGILGRMSETTVASQLDNINVRIVDEAIAPTSAITADAKKITLNAIAIGIGCLIVIPILLELINNKIHTYWDINVYLKRNLLGEIPPLNRIDPDVLPFLVINKLDEQGVEIFRSLYGQVSLVSEMEYPKSILVTSTLPGEGKSSALINLSAAFASHGRRVLMVDCDFRRPMLHRYLNLDNSQGLVSWWTNGSKLEADNLTAQEDLGIQEVSQRLFLLPSGGNFRNSTEMLADERFSALIYKLKREFDLIVIDTAPAGLFIEASQIATEVEEVIYIAQQNGPNRNRAKQAIANLEKAGPTILGIILNFARGPGAQRYGYYGYSYTQDSRAYRYYERRDEDRKTKKKKSSKEKEKQEEEAQIASR